MRNDSLMTQVSLNRGPGQATETRRHGPPELAPVLQHARWFVTTVTVGRTPSLMFRGTPPSFTAAHRKPTTPVGVGSGVAR